MYGGSDESGPLRQRSALETHTFEIGWEKPETEIFPLIHPVPCPTWANKTNSDRARQSSGSRLSS